MDNILEKLSEEKKENYIEYLNLMSSSCNNTSKKLIPFFAVNRKRILDVGCESGILVKNIREIDKKSYILGIDLNINAVRECKKQKIENTEFLKITTFNTYPEEYLKYLSTKIEITKDIEKLLKENIVFIVAKKGE